MEDRRLTSGILALVGGCLMVLGSLFPWAQVVSVFGTVTVNGTEGDGKITIVLGLVVAVLGLLAIANRRAKLHILVPILGLVGGGIGLLDLLNASSKFESVASDGFVHPSIGIGLYLVILGGIATLVAALFGATNRSVPATNTFANNRIVPASPEVVIQKVVAWGAGVPGVVIETNGTTTVTFKDRHLVMTLTVLPVSGGSQVTTSGEASAALSTRLEALWATVPQPVPPPPGGPLDDRSVDQPPVVAESSPNPAVNTYGF